MPTLAVLLLVMVPILMVIAARAAIRLITRIDAARVPASDVRAAGDGETEPRSVLAA